MTAVVSSSPRTVPDVLDKAAAMLDECGWTQGTYRNDTGCMCVLGAIERAAASLAVPGSVWGNAELALSSRLGRSPAAWNDAPERTAAEVTALLREVAAAERGATP